MGLAACASEPPVLTGVPDAPLLSDWKPASEAAPPPAAQVEYKRAEGVVVDAPYLAGRSLASVREVVVDQLGALMEARELGGEDGRELAYEHGKLRVAEDLIYCIELAFPEPVRRSEALRQVGLPEQVDDWLIFHREYRLNHEWGFRRIRLGRQSPEDEEVLWIQLWRWVPGERTGRR